MSDPVEPQAHGKQFLYSAVLADVLDGLGHRTSALPRHIRPLDPAWKLLGRAVTLDVIGTHIEPAKPYELEMQCVDSLQRGDVLVATTNGDLGSALWGELLSTACKAREVQGVVLDGLTRDAQRIGAMNFPVFAAGFSPLDSRGRLEARSFNQPIRIGDCIVHRGDWVFGDLDGVVVIPAELAEAAFAKAIEKATGENRVREELAAGKSVKETFARYGIL